MSRKSLIFGVGVNDSSHPIFSNGKVDKTYEIWHSMLRRCYSKVYHSTKPTYIGCSASEDFKFFTRFEKWATEQKGFGNNCWHLDKDLLVDDNREYCAEYCVFVPSELNLLFLKGAKCRVDNGLPIGVSFKSANKKYVAQCRVSGVEKHLGLFSSIESAKQAYENAKKEEVIRIVTKFEDQLDERVVQKLLNTYT